jgi:hypothetical protein
MAAGGYDFRVSRTWDIRQLGSADLDLIGEIDRSEHMDVEYSVQDGEVDCAAR